MKNIRLTVLVIVALFTYPFVIQAQTNSVPLDLKTAPKFWVDTINKKYTEYVIDDNFLVYQEFSRLANRNSELPIFVQLIEGRLYHFLIFTDPETKKTEMKLGLRGVGHIVTDKFYPQRAGEFYTEFSFACPRNGMYLLTTFQRASKKRLLTHIAILQKERGKNNVQFGYD